MKKIKLYGCGSEHTEEEKDRSLKEGYPCLFCVSEESLEYLGEFDTKDCYNV